MQSRRDQVQAHMFVMGRLTSGMLRGDPDAPESPQGRTNRGIALGIVIAVLLSAGAFVFGLLKPGTTDSWKEAGTLIVDKDTGSRYLYSDGRLRPVRNYASARLLTGAEMKTVAVGGASLRGTPHGTPVGIAGAPDVLPAAGDLETGAWQVCSASATGPAGTTLTVGGATGGQGLPTDRALLVSGPDGTDHLVWRGSKLRLDRAGGAPEALGYASTPRVRVSAAFLNALPSGPGLQPPEVPGRGGEGPALSGRETRIGEVFRITVPGAAGRYHLLTEDGLAPLTATLAALVLGDPDTRKEVYGGRAATAADLGADALVDHRAPVAPGPAGLPESPPEVLPLDSRTLCVRVGAGESGTRVGVALTPREALGPAAQAPAEGLTPACLRVDRITVPPGGGALVHVLGAGGGDLGGTVYLVTDTGMKYRVGTEKAAVALGYTVSRAQGLPAPLLAMLPTGPDLTPEAAVTGRARTTSARCDPT